MITRRVKQVSDADEKRAQESIARDKDATEATDEELAKAKSFGDALPDLAASIKYSRDRAKTVNAKQQISICLEPSLSRNGRRPDWGGKPASMKY